MLPSTVNRGDDSIISRVPAITIILAEISEAMRFK